MRMYCKDCHEVVEVREIREYMDGGDGRNYCFNVEWQCEECCGDNLTGFNACACGNVKSSDDEFCSECYTSLNQTLTEFMEEHGLNNDQLEDLIMNHFGW